MDGRPGSRGDGIAGSDNLSPASAADRTERGQAASGHHDDPNIDPLQQQMSQQSTASRGMFASQTKPPGENRGASQLAVIAINDVFDIHRVIRFLVGMVANVWGRNNHITTPFRMVQPGIVRCHVGSGSHQNVYVLPGFLLQDMIMLGSFHEMPHSASDQLQKSKGVADPTVVNVSTEYHTAYFPHLALLLKLRWLLRLQSALCELDHKVCSLKPLIVGIQHVVLQQYAQSMADSGFDNKVTTHMGSHIQLDSVLDDLTDQLHKSLGKSWPAFLEYVGTCDPSRSLYSSKMERSQPVIISNDAISKSVDIIFVANFLRQPLVAGAPCRLGELYRDLKQFHIPIPELPPLRNAIHLCTWAIAQTKPTRRDRQKSKTKAYEQLVQLDAALLTAAIELHDPDVFATGDEIVDVTGKPANDLSSSAYIESMGDLGGGANSGGGPPAAKVIVEDKPQLKPNLFFAACSCLHHHKTFPVGIRERLFQILHEQYGISEEQRQRLGIAATQDIEGHRLTEGVLLEMDSREKLRLRNYSVKYYSDTDHLLKPSLVPCDKFKGKPAHYTLPPKMEQTKLPRVFGSTSGGLSMSKTLPDLGARPKFKVPLSTGPLTMDHDLKKLRTTGFFIKMPNLGT